MVSDVALIPSYVGVLSHRWMLKSPKGPLFHKNISLKSVFHRRRVRDVSSVDVAQLLRLLVQRRLIVGRSEELALLGKLT